MSKEKKVWTETEYDAMAKFAEANPEKFKGMIGEAMLKNTRDSADQAAMKVVTRLEKKEHFLPNGETDFIETIEYDRNGAMIRRESTNGFGNVVYRDKDGNKLSRYSFTDFGAKKFDEDGNPYPVFSCTDCPIEDDRVCLEYQGCRDMYCPDCTSSFEEETGIRMRVRSKTVFDPPLLKEMTSQGKSNKSLALAEWGLQCPSCGRREVFSKEYWYLDSPKADSDIKNHQESCDRYVDYLQTKGETK